MTAVGALQADAGQPFAGGGETVGQQIDTLQIARLDAKTEHFQQDTAAAAAYLQDRFTGHWQQPMPAQKVRQGTLSLLQCK